MKEPTAPTCGCHAGLDRFEREALRAVATAQPAHERGRLRVDHAALQRALGGREEVIEALTAKAAGRPGVNASKIWAFLTTSLYQSGDLPLLATRESLQNGFDAIKAAIRAHKLRAGEGRFEVSWDPARRSLTWTDNGIGMDARTILDKFLSLGESGKADAGSSDEAAGGFGVAKAVILGASESFRWELHTRDNLAVSKGANAEVEIFDATGHLLPAIAILVANVLRLPVKPSDDQRRISKLERDLERARASAKGSRKAAAEAERIQAALDAARAELADAVRRSAEARAACDVSCGCRSGRARRIVDAAVAALRGNPPPGLVAADVAAFADRQRDKLVGLVDAALAGRS